MKIRLDLPNNKKTILIFYVSVDHRMCAYKMRARESYRRFYASARASFVFRAWPRYLRRGMTYLCVRYKSFASRGAFASRRLADREIPPVRDWFRSASSRRGVASSLSPDVQATQRLYSNIVPGSLSRCKTRNTTRQIMPPPRLLPFSPPPLPLHFPS